MKRVLLLTAAAAGVVIAGAGVLRLPSASSATPPLSSVGDRAALHTSRDSLQSIIIRMRARVLADAGDGEAAVLLADAIIRAARVDGDATLPLEAERAIRAALAHDANDYPARRMLGAVLLAQHRFREAAAAAREAQSIRPADPWNYAVIGDALLELGEYDAAFDAFDELNRRRPDATSYARAAYAREVQGDLEAAQAFMRMAAAATGAHDPEAHAWYLSQLGHLSLLNGRIDEAEQHFAQAEFTFSGHPYAHLGRVRILVAKGDLRRAYTLLALGPDTPETWAIRGDLARRLGDAAAASAAYGEAERLERDGWEQEEPQPGALARFLAERNLKTGEAVALAEKAAAERRDIHTMDALAWAYFRTGQVGRASEAIRAALRTGTRDPRIRCHATAIASAAAGGTVREDACDPLDTLATPAGAFVAAAHQSEIPPRP